MYATDFLFNGQLASDHDVMICTFDSSSGELLASGGELEYITAKSSIGEKNNFYGAQYNSPIEWNFSLCRYACSTKSPYFSQEEERELMKWLVCEDGYKWLQFDANGYEDVYYQVYITALPHQVLGKTVGYDLKVITNSPHAYSQEITNTAIINAENPMRLFIKNDTNKCIFPLLKIIPTKNIEALDIINTSDESQVMATRLTNIHAEKPIEIDCEHRVINGIQSASDFNYRYIRLLDRENEIATNCKEDIKIELKYREIRRILI